MFIILLYYILYIYLYWLVYTEVYLVALQVLPIQISATHTFSHYFNTILSLAVLAALLFSLGIGAVFPLPFFIYFLTLYYNLKLGGMYIVLLWLNLTKLWQNIHCFGNLGWNAICKCYSGSHWHHPQLKMYKIKTQSWTLSMSLRTQTTSDFYKSFYQALVLLR